jgi:hypothetical protein
VCNTVPRLAHARSHLCHPGPARRRFRTAAPTAKSGRVARWSVPQGPTPPSSTAAPSHTPPRRCLRGAQATTGSRTSGRKGTPVSAAARGPVSAAADTPAPLDCPRKRLGCQAAFLPPIGSATRSNSRYALPHRSAPQGAQEGRHRRRCALPVRLILLTPTPPLGALRIATAPGWKRLCRSCRFLVRLFAPPWASPNRGRRPPRCAGSLGLRLALCGLSSLLARLRNVVPQDSCGKARPRCAPAGRPPRSGRQQRPRGGPGGPRYWRTTVAGPARIGARRRTRVPDAALAWTGVQCGGSVPPHPSL